MKPHPIEPEDGTDDALRDTAARWVVQRDRKLSAAEATEFEAWRAIDPRHAAAFERSAATWRMQREIGAAVRRMSATEPAPRARWTWAMAGGLAAAAAMMFFSGPRGRPEVEPSVVAVQAVNATKTRVLADGSVARLKDGAEIAAVFSATERRVELMRGEAYFTVTKDPDRPFYVEAGNVTVRAVGTAFSVHFESHAVDVLVTEGTVQVTPPAGDALTSSPIVKAGHRVVVARMAEAQTLVVVVTAVSSEEIARALAWSEPMFELAGARLGELVASFAQRTGRRIKVSDPALATVRVGGRFPTDDVDGFLRALEAVYDVKADRQADGSVVLRRAR